MSERRINPWLAPIVGAVIGLIGWVVVISLLGDWPVTAEQDRRFLFFAGIWLGVSGVSMPLAWLLHRRFDSPDAGASWPSFGVLARQAVWAGVWVTACAWLQMHRTLNWAMALLLLLVFILLEALLLTRREAGREG